MNRNQLKQQIVKNFEDAEITKKERLENVMQCIDAYNKQLSMRVVGESLPNSKEPISLIIKQIEDNANRIIEEVKQVNKFTVSKKTLEEMAKLNKRG